MTTIIIYNVTEANIISYYVWLPDRPTVQVSQSASMNMPIRLLPNIFLYQLTLRPIGLCLVQNSVPYLWYIRHYPSVSILELAHGVTVNACLSS